MKSIVSLARFSTLAARFVTMRAGSSIIIQSEPHPESGETCAVTLKYDGDGYLLDGHPLMESPRPSRDTRCPWNASAISGGCMPWKASAQAAMALLGAKESQAARDYCAAEDAAFIAANGQWAR
jgi:hypothetical protein